MDWKTLLLTVAVPVGRSVAGWIEVSLKDGEIQSYEIKRLFETIFRVGAPGIVAYFGLNAAGIDVPIIATMLGATLFDYVYHWFKKIKKLDYE